MRFYCSKLCRGDKEWTGSCCSDCFRFHVRWRRCDLRFWLVVYLTRRGRVGVVCLCTTHLQPVYTVALTCACSDVVTGGSEPLCIIRMHLHMEQPWRALTSQLWETCTTTGVVMCLCWKSDRKKSRKQLFFCFFCCKINYFYTLITVLSLAVAVCTDYFSSLHH